MSLKKRTVDTVWKNIKLTERESFLSYRDFLGNSTVSKMEIVEDYQREGEEEIAKTANIPQFSYILYRFHEIFGNFTA